MLSASALMVAASLTLGQTDGMPSNYEQLKDLDYLVGQWKAEGTGPDGSKFTVLRSYKWILNKNFVSDELVVRVGDRQVWASMGLFGWDPSQKKIKSWSANASGGLGQVTWTKHDDGGTGEYSGITADGQEVSAKHTIVGTSEDAFTYGISDLKIGDNTPPEMKFDFTRTKPDKSPSIIKETDQVSDNYKRLKDHDCFAGDWVGTGSTSSGQEFGFESTSKWVLNKNFLLTDSTAKDGDQVVFEARELRAWDPSTREVKQWGFNAWAGISEAVIVKEGDKKWVERTRGIVTDGTEYSAKTVATFTGEDALTILVTDQKVGDDTPGDIKIELKRKKPAKK
ncbi:MAG: hypothetical protein ACYSWU_25325 [Planctomycetota bacterium]|jgi:hypothetical protein